jgi:LmbE family N-acetylglucosaminyl deacetylase
MTETTNTWDTSQKILVILAHPDDPEFFCGGTLAKWAREGHDITYILITAGDKGFNPATQADMTPEKLVPIRKVEQADAAKVIGANPPLFLDLPDGYLIPDLNLRRIIVREIRRHKPDILITCDPQNLFAVFFLQSTASIIPIIVLAVKSCLMQFFLLRVAQSFLLNY